MNWMMMSTLPVVMFGMRWAGSWRTNSTLRLVVEEALGQDPRHGDVHADEFALVVLEMPGRVRAAGADDQLAAIEHGAQQAAGAACAAAFSARQRHRRGGDAGDRQAGRAELQKLSACLLVFHGILRPVPPLSIGIWRRTVPDRRLRSDPIASGVRPVYRTAIQILDRTITGRGGPASAIIRPPVPESGGGGRGPDSRAGGEDRPARNGGSTGSSSSSTSCTGTAGRSASPNLARGFSARPAPRSTRSCARSRKPASSRLGPDGKVFFGKSLYFYGVDYLREHDLVRRGRDEVDRLAQETGETSQFCVMHENKYTVVHMRAGSRPFRISSDIGTQIPLPWTASGRLLLSHLSEAEIRALVRPEDLRLPNGPDDPDRGLPRFR